MEKTTEAHRDRGGGAEIPQRAKRGDGGRDNFGISTASTKGPSIYLESDDRGKMMMWPGRLQAETTAGEKTVTWPGQLPDAV
jgi:hypothetical protein